MELLGPSPGRSDGGRSGAGPLASSAVRESATAVSRPLRATSACDNPATASTTAALVLDEICGGFGSRPLTARSAGDSSAAALATASVWQCNLSAAHLRCLLQRFLTLWRWEEDKSCNCKQVRYFSSLVKRE